MGKAVATLVVFASLIVAPPAAAALRSGSATFNLNSSATSFNPPPQLPLLAIAVSYDDAGTITLTESGGNVPQDVNDAERFGTPWSAFGWEFDTVSLFSVKSTEIDISQFGASLGDSQVDGSLQPQVTPSSDGTSVTAVFSSPLLAGLDLTYVQIEGTTVCTDSSDCYDYEGGNFYFPGHAPTISITSPGTVSAQVGFAAPPVQLSARLAGVASADQSSGITSFAAIGLPPGLTMNRVGRISGKPTRPGHYVTTVTATGQYNDSSEKTSGGTTFAWNIARPVARIPTFLGAPYRGKGLGVRPRLISYTGDGTGFFAGIGKAGHRPNVGHLRWSEWTPTDALAAGGDWADNCTPDCATGLRTAYKVKLHAYRPAVIHGYNVFSRLAVRFTRKLPPYAHRRAYTLSLAYADGFFWR